MIQQEFEAYLLAAYGKQEIDPEQKKHLRLAFANGAQLGCAAAIRATLANTKTNDVTGALRDEIVSEMKAASGPAIVLEVIDFALEVVEPPATPEETKAIMAETLDQIKKA